MEVLVHLPAPRAISDLIPGNVPNLHCATGLAVTFCEELQWLNVMFERSELEGCLYRHLDRSILEKDHEIIAHDFDLNEPYLGQHPVGEEEFLIRWERQELNGPEIAELREHLIECPLCRSTLSDIVSFELYDLPQIFKRPVE
ncbi:MAG: hypothetical protein KDB03_18515 [Planctomycetales bacterium]|nr:hypothetical protein [Planctomycetales bacterium]